MNPKIQAMIDKLTRLDAEKANIYFRTYLDGAAVTLVQVGEKHESTPIFKAILLDPQP